MSVGINCNCLRYGCTQDVEANANGNQVVAGPNQRTKSNPSAMLNFIVPFQYRRGPIDLVCRVIAFQLFGSGDFC